MLKYIIRFSLFLVFILLSGCSKENKLYKLNELYNNRQYFRLRKELSRYQNDNSDQVLFYKGLVDNLFGNYASSIKLINKYLKENRYMDTLKNIECYKTLARDYAKTFQYLKAYDSYNKILTEYRSHLSDKDTKDYDNSVKLFELIKNFPPQESLFKNDTKLKMINRELPVDINGNKINLPFDSGANISVIISSLANKFGFEVSDEQIEVGSITGEKVKARMGLAKKLIIGGVKLLNVVFLVLDDRDMYIKQADFQLRGLLGAPVMEALREITISRSGEVRIPAAPDDCSLKNLCFDGYQLIVKATYKGNKLAFTLDTGADKTKLDLPFYEKYRKKIENHFPLKKKKMTGVGGVKEFNAYEMTDFSLKIGGKIATLKEINVFTEKNTGGSKYFYGNLGQDIINQFNSITFNFYSMCVTFN